METGPDGNFTKAMRKLHGLQNELAGNAGGGWSLSGVFDRLLGGWGGVIQITVPIMIKCVCLCLMGPWIMSCVQQQIQKITKIKKSYSWIHSCAV